MDVSADTMERSSQWIPVSYIAYNPASPDVLVLLVYHKIRKRRVIPEPLARLPGRRVGIKSRHVSWPRGVVMTTSFSVGATPGAAEHAETIIKPRCRPCRRYETI